MRMAYLITIKQQIEYNIVMKKNNITRISLEEVRKHKPTKEDIERFKNFKEDFTDPECPPTPEEDFDNFRFVRDVHPKWFKKD